MTERVVVEGQRLPRLPKILTAASAANELRSKHCTSSDRDRVPSCRKDNAMLQDFLVSQDDHSKRLSTKSSHHVRSKLTPGYSSSIPPCIDQIYKSHSIISETYEIQSSLSSPSRQASEANTPLLRT